MEREKVLKGLAACRMDPDWAEDCRKLDCPYCGAGSCVALLANDAYRLLMEQEPRVMSLEEVRNIPYGHVLIETDKADSLRWVDALLFSRNTNFSFDFITLEGRARLLGSEYGREWRCWTSRPTDAQREATPWES